MNWQIEENNLDYKTYFALRESVGWSNFSPKQAEIAIANSYYSIVVKDLENEVAMGRVAGDGMYFTIVDIVVKPEFQGRGIGTMILQAILKHIERNLPEGSRASIGLISEIGKESFYIKQGFKLIPHQFCGCALRKIILK